MTIENLATIEDVRKYHFDPKEVIKGLNGYYESDKRNSYITVRRYDVEGPAYLSTNLWLSALIEWLREDHDIFYYPGMDILDSGKAGMEAKKETVWKNVMNCIRQEASQNGFDLPRACQDLIEDLKKRDAEIKELKERIAELESNFKAVCDEDDIFRTRALKAEVRQLNSEHIAALDGIKILNAELATKWTKTSLINWLQQRARHKGVELDDAFLYSDDVQYEWTDIVDFLFDEIVKMRGEIENLTETSCKDIMDYIRYEASQNGYSLPEEIDGEPLTVKRVFHDLLELLVKRTAEIREVNDKRWKDLRDIYKALGCDGMNGHIDDFAKAVKARAGYIESLSRNAERETRKAVNEQLKKDTDYIAEVLRDVLEALGISKSDTMRFDVFGLKTKALQRASVIKSEHERYREQLGKATADYKALSEEHQNLKSSQKSDINKLIRDCCTKHDIVAPSRYLSDEACVEYLFSLIEQKDRSFAILQELYRDIFKKQPDGLSAEDIANKILDKVLETEALLHKSVDNYKLSLKDYILHDIKEHDYRYNGLETKSIEEIIDWIITMATHAYKEVEDVQEKTRKECYDYLWNALNKLSPECDALRINRYEDLVNRIFYEMSLVTDNCKQCQRKHSTEKLDYIRRTNKAEEELKKLKSTNEANNDVIKKLKELLNEINKEEDGEWFKP